MIGFIWDQTCAGESTTMPHLRNPPLQIITLDKYVTGTLQFRSGNPTDYAIVNGDCFVFTDGGRSGYALLALYNIGMS